MRAAHTRRGNHGNREYTHTHTHTTHTITVRHARAHAISRLFTRSCLLTLRPFPTSRNPLVLFFGLGLGCVFAFAHRATPRYRSFALVRDTPLLPACALLFSYSLVGKHFIKD